MQSELTGSQPSGAQEPFDGLFQEFKEHAEAVGARVSRVESIVEAASIIASSQDLPTVTHRHTTTDAVLAAYPALTAALNEHGIALRIAEDLAKQGEHDNPQFAGSWASPNSGNPQTNVAAAL